MLSIVRFRDIARSRPPLFNNKDEVPSLNARMLWQTLAKSTTNAVLNVKMIDAEDVHTSTADDDEPIVTQLKRKAADLTAAANDTVTGRTKRDRKATQRYIVHSSM